MLKQVLRDSGATLKRHPGLFLGLGLLFNVPFELNEHVFGFDRMNVRGWIVDLLALALAQWVAIVIAAAARYDLVGKVPTFGLAVQHANARFKASALVSLQFSLVLLAALCLFVIPAIYVAPLFAFTWLVPIMEDDPRVNAFRFTRCIMRGGFSSVVVLFALLLVPSVVGPGLDFLLPGKAWPLRFVVSTLVVVGGTVAQVRLYATLRARRFPAPLSPLDHAWLHAGFRPGWTLTLLGSASVVPVGVALVMLVGTWFSRRQGSSLPLQELGPLLDAIKGLMEAQKLGQ